MSETTELDALAPALELTNISKSFLSVEAVKSVTIRVPSMQTTVLIGPRRCGKSTLLRLMIGQIFPDTGTILFKGTRITPKNVLELRRKMGYISQSGGLFPHLTARQNAALVPRFLSWAELRTRKRLEDLANLVHFPGDHFSLYPQQLPPGERERVGLMRALILDPDVVLIDETFRGLDPMVRADLQQEFKRAFTTLKKSVVMTTDNIAEAGIFGDKVVLLREGEAIQRGKLEDLFKKPAERFVVEFINAQRPPHEALEAIVP